MATKKKATKKSTKKGAAKAAPSKVLISFILDKSGSMRSQLSSVLSGFAEYLETLRQDKSTQYEMSLTLFDTFAKTGKVTPLATVADLTEETYVPSGMTALYDAIGQTLNRTDPKGRGIRNLVVIFTDGEENSSNEFDRQKIAKMIAMREKRGNYTFVFLGADQDAWANSRQMGMSAGNTMSYSSCDTLGTFRMAAANTVAYSATTANSPIRCSSVQDFFAPAAPAQPTAGTPTPKGRKAIVTGSSH